MKLNTTKVPETKCPRCGTVLAAATGIREQDRIPEPGSLTVCIQCGEMMAFVDDLTLRGLTAEEVLWVKAEVPQLVAMSRKIQARRN